MTSATFRVTTQGLRPGYSAELAADQVAALFKCGKAQIAPLLGDKPVVVKRGLTQEAAGKYARALEGCGCVCAIEAESAPADGDAAPPQAAPPSRQLSAVIPVLRRAAPRSADADPVVVQPFVGDLEIVFRTAADGDFVRQAALTASMMSVDRLHELAVHNLYALMHPRLTFRQFVLEDSAGGTAGPRFFFVRGNGRRLRGVLPAAAACLGSRRGAVQESVADRRADRGDMHVLQRGRRDRRVDDVRHRGRDLVRSG